MLNLRQASKELFLGLLCVCLLLFFIADLLYRVWIGQLFYLGVSLGRDHSSPNTNVYIYLFVQTFYGLSNEYIRS